MFSPRFIVLHHSLTPTGQTASWGDLRKYHVENQKELDIGYHWGVELLEGYYEILVGRSMESPGFHCKDSDMDGISIGICCVGNFDIAPPPEDQIKSLVRVTNWVMDIFQISRSRVVGHREAGFVSGRDWRKGQYKSCPGIQFSIDDFRKRLRL